MTKFTDLTIRTGIYSSFVIDPWGAGSQWNTFSYSRSQDLLGAPPGVKAGRSHTNVPRSGDMGLPKDWEMAVESWHATLSVPLDQVVLDWAAESFAQFEYN